MRTPFVALGLTLALGVAPPVPAQDAPEPGLTVLSATDCRDSADLDLAPAPNGFFAVWDDAADWLQRFGPEGARRSVQRPIEPPPGGFVQHQRVATRADGSGVVAWTDTRSDEVYADFFDAAGRLDGDPLPLGTLPDGFPTLSLSHLGDGTFALADDQTDTAVVFGADRTVRPVDLGHVYGHHDFLRVGDELWHTGSRFEDPATADRVLLEVRRMTLEGAILGTPLPARSTPPPTAGLGTLPGVALARDDSGRISLAWIAGDAVELHRFDATGALLSSRPDISRGYGIGSPANVDLVTDPAGNRLVVWDGKPGPEDPGFELDLDLIRGASFLADDTPAFQDEVIANPFTAPSEGLLGAHFWEPRAALTGAGRGAVGFSGRHFPGIGLPPPCFLPDTSLVRNDVSVGGDRWVLLRQGRFRVEVDWTDPFNGGSGIGHAVPGTEDAGSFWFFDPDTKEIEVKILDGRSINGHFWVFAAGLSNVGYTLTVTDQHTGAVRRFVNPPREFGNFIDTTAFEADGPTERLSSPRLPPLRLSTAFSCDPQDPDLEPVADGFLAAWGQDGEGFLRLFDEDGAPLGPEPSKHTLDSALGTVPETALAVASDGARLWVGLRDDGEVFARLTLSETQATFLDLFRVPATTVPGAEVLAAALDDGSFVVAESVQGRAARLTRDGGVTRFDLPATGRSPALLGKGNELWYAYIADIPRNPPETPIRVHRLSAVGEPVAPPFLVDNTSRYNAQALALAEDGRGRVHVAWWDNVGGLLAVLQPDGTRVIGPLLLWPAQPGETLPPRKIDLVADHHGNSLAVWVETRLDGTTNRVRTATHFADAFGSLLATVDPPVLEAGPGQTLSDPAVVRLAGGEVMVAARLDDPLAPTAIECADPAAVVAAKKSLGGVENLLLRHGRFRVFVDWSDPFNGGAGDGRAVPGTEDAGSFWFFSPDTKEVEVKILDGRTINGNFWVFAAGLSNVGYRIVVIDQLTRTSKVYTNPPREYGNFIDTTSFPG